MALICHQLNVVIGMHFNDFFVFLAFNQEIAATCRTSSDRITRMFCEGWSICKNKIAKPKLVLVNTHDPCQNAIVRSQRVKCSADLAHLQMFFTSKIIILVNIPFVVKLDAKGMHSHTVLHSLYRSISTEECRAWSHYKDAHGNGRGKGRRSSQSGNVHRPKWWACMFVNIIPRPTSCSPIWYASMFVN